MHRDKPLVGTLIQFQEISERDQEWYSREKCFTTYPQIMQAMVGHVRRINACCVAYSVIQCFPTSDYLIVAKGKNVQHIILGEVLVILAQGIGESNAASVTNAIVIKTNNVEIASRISEQRGNDFTPFIADVVGCQFNYLQPMKIPYRPSNWDELISAQSTFFDTNDTVFLHLSIAEEMHLSPPPSKLHSFT